MSSLKQNGKCCQKKKKNPLYSIFPSSMFTVCIYQKHQGSLEAWSKSSEMTKFFQFPLECSTCMQYAVPVCGITRHWGHKILYQQWYFFVSVDSAVFTSVHLPNYSPVNVSRHENNLTFCNLSLINIVLFWFTIKKMNRFLWYRTWLCAWPSIPMPRN